MINIMENTHIHNETTHAHSTPHVVSKKQKNYSNLITPGAIILAGILIAIALYTRGNPAELSKNNKDLVNGALTGPKVEFTDIKSTDHIRGSKDAKIVFIEYSDIECPYCKQYHVEMKKVYDELGKDKEVAWVYRHFPISYGKNPRHPNSAKKAEATECAAEIGGSDMFWRYLDEIYSASSINGELDISKLPEIAITVGLDKEKFKACLDSGKYAAKVKDSYDEAVKAGAKGTPYTVVKYKNEFIPLLDANGDGLGALKFEMLKQIVSELLSQD